jgi:hypothetical protein
MINIDTMPTGADDPETLNEFIAPQPTPAEAVGRAAFDPDLIAHTVRCWQAECENAERLSRKIGLLVSVLAILFGLGLYKIEWTYDPRHFSRIQPEIVLWIVKTLLAFALLCFLIGLTSGLTRIRREPAGLDGEDDPIEAASAYLHFPKEIVASPPVTDLETRAVVFYRYSAAIDAIRNQNAAKSRKVKICEFWFLLGLFLVFLSVASYTFSSFPPIRDKDDPTTTHPVGFRP